MSAGAAAVIRTRPCAECPQCGAPGRELHRNLTDVWFSAPGVWNVRRCDAAECGLTWLDPMPLAEDLAVAYRTYYTHASAPRDTLARRLYTLARDGYFARRSGYPSAGPLGLGWLLGLAFHASAGRRETLDMMTMGLPPRPGGRCVDVGCGDGARVAILRRLGWDAEGLEVDETAVSRARAAGVPVVAATLEGRAYPAGSLDAVAMAHVIEHVPDPFATLRECHRVLAPGGYLTLATPNTTSLGARRFGARWRGLEIPRHLHLFDPRSMARALRAAGFSVERLWTSARIAGVILEESEDPASVRVPLSERQRTPERRRSMSRFERDERRALQGDPGAGEELRVIARR